MDADLDHEISCRSAIARTAFHEVRRQIFRNQALSVQTRITLLHSLVFSKLFYGCGSWYEIPRRVAAQLDGLMIRFYRSVVDKGFWNDSHATDAELRAHHALPTFRVHLAVARLRFFQHVAKHDHDFHRSLLLEERTYNKGWLLEVEDDLNWMRECAELPDLPTTPTNCEEWKQLFDWFRTTRPPWKAWLKRSLKMHFLREGMADECKRFHADAIKILKDYGATIHEPVASTDGQTSHACPECHQLFPSSTAVAVHRAKKHGIKAQIPTLVQSAVCPGCEKFMWTSARVIQHLRYRPNQCLDRVAASRIPKEHFAVELPDHLRRVKRLPCKREHYGPLPLPHEKERVEMRERLRACEDHGAKYDYWSKVNPALTTLASSKFTAAANQWLATDPDNGEELYSALLEAMARLPYPERVQEKCLIHWIEFSMWDACSDWPRTALDTLEKEHQHILANLYPSGHYGRSASSYIVCYNLTPLQLTEYINLTDTGHTLPSRRGLRRSRPATGISRVRNYIGALWSLPAFPFLAYHLRVTEPFTSSTSTLADVDFTIYNGSWSNCLGRGTARSRSSASTPLYTACVISTTRYSGITSLASRTYDGTTVRDVERGETRSFME